MGIGSASTFDAAVSRLRQLGLLTMSNEESALLQETEKRHGEYEPTAPKHHWSEWYAAYMVARVQGRTAEDAAAAGKRRIEGQRDRVSV